MNDSLEHDFSGFECSKIAELDENSSKVLEKLENQIKIESEAEDLEFDLPQCEICGQRFSSKKELRSHIIVHLGQPRVVLKRISNLKTVKKKHSQRYKLNTDQTGKLKITLKKQPSPESLKLTLKKSLLSEDFTIINSNLAKHVAHSKTEEKVAGVTENEAIDAQESSQESYKDMTVNEEDNYSNDNFDVDDASPIKDRSSVEANEGDSGVGSDMANPLEKEDQNVDDVHNSKQYESLEKNAEGDQHDESDALETCRETIENLRKLGKQSSISIIPRANSILPDSSPIPEDENLEMPSDIILNLEESTNSPTFTENPTSSPSPREENKSESQTEESSNFAWNNILEKEPKENNNAEQSVSDGGESSHHESLLQNFLMEHHKRSQRESLSSTVSPFETEYVSLEKLAETVTTCRVCNEKFKDMAHLDAHKTKCGHHQCNIPECSSLMFSTPMEVTVHKAQVHGAPMSPNVSQLSPHMNRSSPHINRSSPHLNQTSPHASAGSPGQFPHSSPLPSPQQQRNSPTFNNLVTGQQMLPPVNFEQLPAPVQQLAQQVQRMPLPQAQGAPSLPPGANTMIPAGSTYYVAGPGPGRPPLYRIAGPQQMHYASHMGGHIYSPAYGPPPSYPHSQMAGPPQMHSQMPQQMPPQMSQQMPRARYPNMAQNVRAPRMPQNAPNAPVPRQRLKRPLPQPVQMQPQNSQVIMKKRMDVLLPDRNEDADCHVIAQQKRNDGVPVIQNVQGALQSSRNDSTIHLTDSITLSVRQPGSAPAQSQNNAASQGKKPDASAVANVLAARGITVTPASSKNKANIEAAKQPAQQPQQRPAPVNVSSLNLNSAISIIPATSQRKLPQEQQQQQQQQQQQSQFVVPQNTQKKQLGTDNVERPPRPPTVDLTQDGPSVPPQIRRGRPPRALMICQVCDKRFQTQELLTQHMATHRTTNKLLHKCHLCPAQYPTLQALTTHKQTYHKEVDTVMQNGAIELAIPVVDLKSPISVSRLSNLGIHNYIPLSQLSAQTGGYFGLPIVNVEGARNPNTYNLASLAAVSILSLGPIKHLPPLPPNR